MRLSCCCILIFIFTFFQINTYLFCRNANYYCCTAHHFFILTVWFSAHQFSIHFQYINEFLSWRPLKIRCTDTLDHLPPVHLVDLLHNNPEIIIKKNFLKVGGLTWVLMCLQLHVIDSAKRRMMNSNDISQFAKSFENLSFLINSASYKIKVEFYILIRF